MRRGGSGSAGTTVSAGTDISGAGTPRVAPDLPGAIGLRYAGRNAELCKALPEILRSLYVHWSPPPPGDRAKELLDDAYSLAHVATYRFGYLDLTAQVDDLRAVPESATTGSMWPAAGCCTVTAARPSMH